MSLKEQLADEQECIAHHQKAINAAVGRRDKVRAQIAEAEKPKLRHGQTGMYTFGDCDPVPAMYIDTLEHPDTMMYGSETAEGALYATSPLEVGSFVAMGHIDDLKALQEPLERFDERNDNRTISVMSTHGKYCNVKVQESDDAEPQAIRLSAGKARALSLAIRRMLATQQRAASHNES